MSLRAIALKKDQKSLDIRRIAFCETTKSHDNCKNNPSSCIMCPFSDVESYLKWEEESKIGQKPSNYDSKKKRERRQK